MSYEIGKKYRHKLTGETGVCVGFATFVQGDEVLIDVIKKDDVHERIWVPASVAEEVAS